MLAPCSTNGGLLGPGKGELWPVLWGPAGISGGTAGARPRRLTAQCLFQIIMVRLQRVTFLALHNYLGLTTELFNPVSAGLVHSPLSGW